jgi:cysteinyl-tRNA synthetase
LNNAVTIADLQQAGYSGRDIRFFLLGMNYRKPLNYSENALQTAKNTLKKLDAFIHRLQAADHNTQQFSDVDQLIYDLRLGFDNAFYDDLNIAGALAVLFDFIGKINGPLAERKINGADAGKIIKALENINEILRIMHFGHQEISGDIADLIKKREEARKEGLWREADRLRNQLAELGVEVSDSGHGTLWRFK